MASMYEDMADYLVSVGLGIKYPNPGANLFGNNMPASPDDIAAVFEQPGTEPDFAMGRIVADTMNLQVLVRDTNGVEARTRAFAIRDALFNLGLLPPAGRTINGRLYFCAIPKHPPFSIGQDENRRHRWSCNYKVQMEP